MLEKWRSYVRANHWWGFKAAPILGFTYLYCHFFDFSYTDRSIIFALSALTIIGIAGFGYVINDIYDLEVDKKAGKNNPFEGKSKLFIATVILILAAFSLLPWTLLRHNKLTWTFLALQLILYFLYAHPFFRLKEKSIWGPICDALYGHAFPIIIACLTYQQYLGSKIPYSSWLFFTSLFFWQFFKGIRNILLHQLEDYENDVQSGLQTFTMQLGKNQTYKVILKFIQPVEVVSLLIFLGAISQFTPWTYVYFGAFIFINIFAHGIFRNVEWNPNVYSQNTYIYFVNNFYEAYLPYFFLFWCLSSEVYAIGILIAHIIFFPSTIDMITTDIRKAAREVWIQLDNLGSRIKRRLIK